MYITAGTFKKYASFLGLKKENNYKVICVDDEEFDKFDIYDSLKIKVIKAQHDDLISDCSSVGFCFRYENCVLIYTGDTGFVNSDMQRLYEKDLRGCINANDKVVLITNLGGFLESEKFYSVLAPEEENNDHYYKYHLGRIRLAKIVDILEPDICIISEFGEEFIGHRVDIAKAFNKVYKKSKTVFLPADIGLCLKYFNDKILVRSKINNGAKSGKDKTTEYAFVEPSDVFFEESSGNSEIIFYGKSSDD